MSSTRERHIDVKHGNYSVIDSEFDNMRDRFEAEMRRVEEEMSRLRREFEGYTPRMQPSMADSIGAPPTRHEHRETSNFSSSSQQSQFQQHSPQARDTMALATRPRYDPFLEGIKSPLIRDDSDGKTLRLRFDVNQYKPEEITVKTVDNRLFVHAKHEEKSPNKSVYREYNQEFMLPRGTNPESISSSLSTDGVLTVEAPLPHMQQLEGGAGGTRIPITHK